MSDGGFLEKKCLSSLYDLCKSFIVGLPNHLKESKEIIEMYGDKVNNYAYQLDVPHTFCLPVPCEVQGIKGKVLLYFDALNHAMLCNELNEKINRYKAELAKLKHYPKSKLSRYEPYFIITKHNGGAGFDYAVDIEKVERLRKRKGMFLIFTTDMDETPENALYHYRAKDVVEKLFDQIKCDMDGNRIRTHSEETTDGKTFVIFIACVIRTYLLNKLSQYLTDSSTSLKKALNQLSNIRVVSSHTGLRFTKALSKKQKVALTLGIYS